MGIQHDPQPAQENGHPSIYEQQTIAQPLEPSPLPPPPHPPSRPPHRKRERWFIVTLIVVLVLVVAVGSVFAVQVLTHPGTQPIPDPTVATHPTPVPTRVALPTPIPTRVSPSTPTPAPPAGISQPLSALWMSNATTGWASTTTHRILRTSDGGNHWQDVTPAYPAGTLTEIPPAFASLNGSVAWVAVSGKQQPNYTIPSVVFRTSNGGHTWQETTLPSGSLGVSQVQFVNAQDGWVLADFGGGAAGSQGVNLFRSTDGGHTWRLVASAPGSIPFNGIKSGMSWASATTGFLTGTIATNTVYLYRTQDAGVSWQMQALSSSFPIQATEPPVFFSATEGLLPVTVYALKGSVISLYVTHDGGISWSYTTMIPFGSAWDFLTLQQGWAVGASGTTLLETSTGGQLWNIITPSANFRHISQLDFVSAQQGWAISTATPAVPVLLKTMDGGRTWVQV